MCAEADLELQRAEARGEPAVFRALVAAAPALRRWSGREGLAYLARVAGSAPVQAMLSPSPEFYGNMDSHEPAECTFGDLISAALGYLGAHAGGGGGGSGGAAADGEAAAGAGAEAAGGGPAAARDGAEGGQRAGASGRGGAGEGPFMYLAQQPLASPGLEALAADAPTPPVLGAKELSSANLWMSPRESRSSLHYDPYQNLLTVLTGAKTVTLISPEATPALYPRSPLGESPNHSSVDIGAPDARRHPLYKLALPQALRVTLRPGDALFIPEGWWHQVDSAPATIAVNYWWTSPASAALRAAPHLHHYYLRLLQASVVAQATQQLLEGLAAEGGAQATCSPEAGSPEAGSPAKAAAAAARAAAADARGGADEAGSRRAAKRARTGGAAADGGGGEGSLSPVEAWAVSSLRHLLAAGEGEAALPPPPPSAVAALAAEAQQAEAPAAAEAPLSFTATWTATSRQSALLAT